MKSRRLLRRLRLLRRKARPRRGRRRRRPQPRRKRSPRKKLPRQRARRRKPPSARNADAFLASEHHYAGPCALHRALTVPRFFLRDVGILILARVAEFDSPLPCSVFPGGVVSVLPALMRSRLV